VVISRLTRGTCWIAEAMMPNGNWGAEGAEDLDHDRRERAERHERKGHG
jgi:hypothetical protein